MAFFGPSYFAATVKKEPLRKREYAKPSKPNKGPHKHQCQTCGFPYLCNFANCQAPGIVDSCYTCKGSFLTFG